MVFVTGGIGPTLLLFLASRDVVRITVVDHYDVEVSNLHWEVIHTDEGGGLTRNARSARDSMRYLNPTVSVMAVTEPLT